MLSMIKELEGSSVLWLERLLIVQSIFKYTMYAVLGSSPQQV